MLPQHLRLSIGAVAAAAIAGSATSCLPAAPGIIAASASSTTASKLAVTVTNLSVGGSVFVQGATVKARAHLRPSFSTVLPGAVIAVRDSQGNSADFPMSTNVAVSQIGTTISNARTFGQPGVYSYWVAYQTASGSWVNLSPRQSFTITAASSPAPPSTAALPAGNWRLAWGDDFNGTALDRSKWATKSDAYAAYNGWGDPECRGNKKDNKLQYLTDGGNLSVGNGTLTINARRQAMNGYSWTSGLLTSGNACGTKLANGYKLQQGDYLQQRAKLPSQLGGWPALWSWGDGANGGEVDTYEFHSDNPNLLEISNRITGGACYHQLPTGNVPDGWHSFGAYLGKDRVDFYLDGKKVCSGGGFASAGAAIITDLSISAGGYGHPSPPTGVNSISMQIDSVRVYRQ